MRVQKGPSFSEKTMNNFNCNYENKKIIERVSNDELKAGGLFTRQSIEERLNELERQGFKFCYLTVLFKLI